MKSQVVLMLSSDLDSEEDKDKSALDALLATLILQLNLQSKVSHPAFRKLPSTVKLFVAHCFLYFLSKT